MKKAMSWLLALVSVFMLFTSCSANASAPAKNTAATPGTAVTGNGTAAPGTAVQDAAGPAATQKTAVQKITKNARLDLEADSSQGAYDKLLGWAKQIGGYEFSRQASTDNTYLVISAQIKLPQEQLDAFLAFAQSVGKVINCSTESKDITSEYYDIQTRLDTKRKSLDKYYEFLKNAQSMDEMLKIQNQIDTLTADIESMEGQIKLWDSLVNESTVTITIREKQDPAKIQKDINWSSLSLGDMLTVMKNGLLTVCSALVTVLQWALIVVVAALPVCLLVFIVVLIVKRIQRARAKRSPAPASHLTDKNDGDSNP